MNPTDDIPVATDKHSEPGKLENEQLKQVESDDEYWEEMLFISRGPAGWNFGCGCG